MLYKVCTCQTSSLIQYATCSHRLPIFSLVSSSTSLAPQITLQNHSGEGQVRPMHMTMEYEENLCLTKQNSCKDKAQIIYNYSRVGIRFAEFQFIVSVQSVEWGLWVNWDRFIGLIPFIISCWLSVLVNFSFSCNTGFVAAQWMRLSASLVSFGACFRFGLKNEELLLWLTCFALWLKEYYICSGLFS